MLAYGYAVHITNIARLSLSRNYFFLHEKEASSSKHRLVYECRANFMRQNYYLVPSNHRASLSQQFYSLRVALEAVFIQKKIFFSGRCQKLGNFFAAADEIFHPLLCLSSSFYMMKIMLFFYVM